MWDFLGPLSSIAGKAFDYMNAKSASNKARDQAAGAFGARIRAAQKHGIHPLAALGANISSGPVVGAFSDFGSIGQDVSRAVNAMGSSDDRLEQLTLKNMELRNQLIEGQIARLQASQLGPGFPVSTDSSLIGGQGDIIGGFRPDPRVAMVVPPDPRTDVIKSFGYDLIANPRDFTRAQTFENQFGEEGPPGWMHNTGSYLDSLARAIVRSIRQQNPWLSTQIMSPATRRAIFEGRW